MKAFSNATPRDLGDAVSLLDKARAGSRTAVVAGGGSDLLGMIKERLVQPDVLVNLKTIRGLDEVLAAVDGVKVGGLITLEALSRHSVIRSRYAALAEAAESVGTPQIRNVATLAGNICQRPWCWYFRNGFPCLKNGGKVCYAVTGENQFHSIFGGGPSYIVHPSDTAPVLVALDARFRIVGPGGERVVPAADFFTLPERDPARENVLGPQDVLAEVLLPPLPAGAKSTYFKVLDREAWTHAVVSAAIVLDTDGDVCRSARIVLGGVAPVPWRLPRVERMLAGQRITPELAAKAGDVAVTGATPLAKNGYKVPLTKAMVRRALLSAAEKHG
jgi:xanthine dehydrogenase YagS FAD-binding subunit